MLSLKSEMCKFGKKLVENNLTTSFFGNLSTRFENTLLVTRSGSMLDELEGDQIVEVSLGKEEKETCATSELCVHKKVIEKTGAKAVMHAHTIYSVLACGLFYDTASFSVAEILPFLKCVPIVGGKSGTEELAENVADALTKNKIIIVKEHGVFACGESMKECYIYVSGLEFYAKELLLKNLFMKNGII